MSAARGFLASQTSSLGPLEMTRFGGPGFPGRKAKNGLAENGGFPWVSQPKQPAALTWLAGIHQASKDASQIQLEKGHVGEHRREKHKEEQLKI